MATAGTILQALKTRIEALTPAEQLSQDDVYRCVIGFPIQDAGDRLYSLTANAGTPAPDTVRCKEWITSVTIIGFYPRRETGILRALTDSEQISADLHRFANNNTDDIFEINQDQGMLIEQDDYTAVERNLRVLYRGQEI